MVEFFLLHTELSRVGGGEFRTVPQDQGYAKLFEAFILACRQAPFSSQDYSQEWFGT